MANKSGGNSWNHRKNSDKTEKPVAIDEQQGLCAERQGLCVGWQGLCAGRQVLCDASQKAV
jgi:hypothetical protein